MSAINAKRGRGNYHVKFSIEAMKTQSVTQIALLALCDITSFVYDAMEGTPEDHERLFIERD